MELQRIADDLAGHVWYGDLVAGFVADVEAFAGRWAAFEDFVAAIDAPADADEPAH